MEDRSLNLIYEKTTVSGLARNAWLKTLNTIRSLPSNGYSSGPNNPLSK